MAEEKKVFVKNRNVGRTGYTLDDNFHRNFEYNEGKWIPLEELQRLSYAPGGEAILRDCLVIDDKSALEVLNLKVEPEYFYSEKDIRKILNEGSLDQLEDTLNFAPDGVIEMIKKIAVEIEIPDTRKRDMISEKTGFNINNAINVNKIMAEGVDEKPKTEAPKRKTQPINATPERKIKIVTKETT